VDNCSKYADGFSNSTIDDTDGHILSPLILFTCTAMRHALLEWQKNKGIHPEVTKSQLKADRHDCLNYFYSGNDGEKNASCRPATGRKLLTSPGVADTYTSVMNTWNTLPESYQQRVYNHTLATVKRQIQRAENPTPAVVISVEAVGVDNAILRDYLASKVALEKPEVGSTDTNILIDNNCTDGKVHSGITGGSGDNSDEAEASYLCDAVLTTSWRRRPVTELERFDLATSDVNRYEGEDGDDADAHEEEEASQADDGSTQCVED